MKIDRSLGLNDNNPKNSKPSRNIDSLNQGDKFKATILDIKRNEVVIQLRDGSIVTAKSLAIPQAHIGDVMEFLVQSNAEGQILLSMIAGEPATQEFDLFSKLLLSADIRPSEEAMVVIKALMDNEIPIDKAIIQEAIHMLKANPELSMETLSFLLKENIPVTPKNIQQVNNTVNNESLLKNQIDLLSWKLVAIDEPNIREQILQIFLPEETQEYKNSALDNKLMTSAILSQEDTVLKLETTEQKEVFKEVTDSLLNNRESMHEAIENIRKGEDIKTIMDILTNKHPENMELMKAINNDSKLLLYFKEFLVKLDVFESLKTELKPEDLSKVIKESLFIDIKNGEAPEEINAYYNKLYEKISNAIELTKTSESINTREATGVLSEIKENIEFMNNINKFQEFIQIPFKLGDKNNQGDLYIFNDKKGKKISKDKASVLLSLDLSVLGHFEAFIQKDYKNISCQFRTMDKKVQALIQTSMPKLEIALRQKGYSLSQVMYKTIEESFSILQNRDDLGFEPKVQETKRYSFDMRA